MMIQLQGLLSTITFLDVIDIVVVAYFLYRLFLMLKNTRAATLGKGLMVLIGFTLICLLAEPACYQLAAGKRA